MKKSAGILLFREINRNIEVFLVHPGGPFWKNRDAGAWSIPKGEFTNDEQGLNAAKREFEEETGISCNGNFIELEPVKQKSGKQIFAWALLKNIDPAIIKSNTFKLEWPPRSGHIQDVPEIDKGAWFDIDAAKEKINPAQAEFIDQLLEKISQRHIF